MPKKSKSRRSTKSSPSAKRAHGEKGTKRGSKKAGAKGRRGAADTRSGSRRPKSFRRRRPVRTNPEEGVRLQKLLAMAGHGSRRECEVLIEEGRVTIDGKVVTQLGTRVDLEQVKVKVDGIRVAAVRWQYFIVNKPTGVLSTCSDPEGRMRVIDLINTDQRVYNVGRLDKTSEGLMLVTNDGELANRLTHPRYGVQKTYMVTVVGNPKWEDLQQLKRGVRLAEAVARVAEVKIKKRRRDTCDLELILNEGRNREIRRLLAHIGHKVTKLQRVAIGPLELGDLKPGQNRRLEHPEIVALREASSMVVGKTRPEKPIETSQMPAVERRKAREEAKAEAAAKGRGKGTAAAKRSTKKTDGASSEKGLSSTKKKSVVRKGTKKKVTKRKGTKKKSSKKAKRKTSVSGSSRRGAGRTAEKKRRQPKGKRRR